MNPINFLTGIILLYSVTGNISGAKKAMKKKLSGVIERPKSFLQKVPPNISAMVLILTIIGIFDIGTLQTEDLYEHVYIRVIGMIMFAVFSWLQIKSYKSLGESYSQDIVILKNQNIITTGLYSKVRHPQYISQVLSDLGAGIALLSYLIVPIVLLVELPLFIMRAKLEESVLIKHNPAYSEYKKKAGFFLPFIG